MDYFKRDGGMDTDSSQLRPHLKALIHCIRKFPFETNSSRRDIICRFRPDRNAKKAELLLIVFKNMYISLIYLKMSDKIKAIC